jgi:adenine-specific DNA-methyltransferase
MMSNHTVRYAEVTQRKFSGAHYTPSRLARFVAQEIKKAWELGQITSNLRILEPAIGDGNLLLALLAEFQDFPQSSIEVIGFDTNPTAIANAENQICAYFPDVSYELHHDDFLDFALRWKQPTLFERTDFEPVDIVISNPPYVRTQIMGAERAQKLSELFGLSGRVDLYFAFIKAIEWMLKPQGIAGIIVSNRFMTTKSGAKVRKNLRENFNIHHVWDLGDTKLFAAAVLPAVLVVEKRNGYQQSVPPKFSSVYATPEPATSSQQVTHIIEALNANIDGVYETIEGTRYRVEHGELAGGKSVESVWRIVTKSSRSWLERVDEHTFCHFRDIGKIRVGVKTTADPIFIRDDWHTFPDSDRPELLKPLTTHHIARRFRAIEPEKKILYTHIVKNGRRTAVDLHQYPQAKRYLETHRAQLEGRKYVIEAGRNWYEIWVPQDPSQWERPKIVFRDIADEPSFWIDFSGSVVNGDCYWFTLAKGDDQLDLLWLALAVGNSSFIEKYYDYKFNNKLYAGRRRYMTQYVQKFPLPDPATELSQQIVALTRRIYDLIPAKDTIKLQRELDGLVWQSFGF